MNTISFISANYVARVLNYNGVEKWGEHDAATIAAAEPELFDAMAADVAAAGFGAIDIWMAHCSWQAASDAYLEAVKASCQKHGLQITSYAGGLSIKSADDVDKMFGFMKRLGAPMFAGGMYGVSDAELAPMVEDSAQKHGVLWAFENHPQKTSAEILAKIGGGKYEHCGVALDTGWCGTQGLDALEAVKAVREKLFILHLKDITEVGKHDTCEIGKGIVPCEGVVRFLKDDGWNGTICIEHEPYDRDPLPEVERSLTLVKQWLS